MIRPRSPQEQADRHQRCARWIGSLEAAEFAASMVQLQMSLAAPSDLCGPYASVVRFFASPDSEQARLAVEYARAGPRRQCAGWTEFALPVRLLFSSRPPRPASPIGCLLALAQAVLVVALIILILVPFLALMLVGAIVSTLTHGRWRFSPFNWISKLLWSRFKKRHSPPDGQADAYSPSAPTSTYVTGEHVVEADAPVDEQVDQEVPKAHKKVEVRPARRPFGM